jgi:hypothetical protein
MAISSNATAIIFNNSTVQTTAFSKTSGLTFTTAAITSTAATLALCTPGAICAPSIVAATQIFCTGATQIQYLVTDMILTVNNATNHAHGTTSTVQYKDIIPITTNVYHLGSTAVRWGAAWVTSGSLVASDENLKTDITSISNQERDVALEVKKNLKRFKFKEAVAKKGFDTARYHFGCIAQEVEQIFRDGGLDPFKYGIIGFDTWYEGVKISLNGQNQEFEDIDISYTPKDGYVKKELHSVRYDELITFILSALAGTSR